MIKSSDWVSVSQAPENNITVLVCANYQVTFAYCRNKADDTGASKVWFTPDGKSLRTKIGAVSLTHWIHIELPK